MSFELIWVWFKSFLISPWTIGIGGGILSGLVVTWVSKKLFSQQEDKEYAQKISSANNEVIYSLRPLISEAALPSISILDSLISATSRKYKVDQKDMCSPKQFFDELIKEVMDSHFVSNDKKAEYCQHLLDLKNQIGREESSLNLKMIESAYAQKITNKRYLDILSIAMGMMVALTTMLLALFEGRPNGMYNLNIINLFLPILAGLMVSLFGALAFISIKKNGGRLSGVLRKIIKL